MEQNLEKCIFLTTILVSSAVVGSMIGRAASATYSLKVHKDFSSFDLISIDLNSSNITIDLYNCVQKCFID
jgi:hypothetical protein